MDKIPYDKTADHSRAMAEKRLDFLKQQTQADLSHIAQFDFDPALTQGNIENFIGVAQVPLGLVGPLLIHGEFAQGHFYVPLATTEGTLVASYNRGAKLAAIAGGIQTTVVEAAMQRAPLFVFENARQARQFGQWVKDHFETIQQVAESTSSVAKLLNIEQYAASKMRWLRFNYHTGDAAGQNMVTKATREACQWILKQGVEGLSHFSLAANFDTDKKHSTINTLHTRGKRVVAELTIPKALMQEVMHIDGQAMAYQRNLSNLGAYFCGSVNNGSHYANGLTALFMATGQDVANIAESASGLTYTEIKPNGDLYFSITIPSLIVATYGGGTGLPTQRECLSILGCYGKDKVNKLAEIAAALVLCGEVSLSSAIIADEWVSSHEKHGRNRP
jgi:hydroxymethylglutaryl-CoA reductase (NADPH)